MPGTRRSRCVARAAEKRRSSAVPNADRATRDRPPRATRRGGGSSRPERDVNEGVTLEDPISLGLGVAAADRDDRVGVAGLLRLRVAKVCGEPLVGLLPDRAGVEDEHVGISRSRCLPEPELLEQAADALGVVRIHLAAKRRDVVAAHAA